MTEHPDQDERLVSRGLRLHDQITTAYRNQDVTLAPGDIARDVAWALMKTEDMGARGVETERYLGDMVAKLVDYSLGSNKVKGDKHYGSKY